MKPRRRKKIQQNLKTITTPSLQETERKSKNNKMGIANTVERKTNKNKTKQNKNEKKFYEREKLSNFENMQ